MDYLAQLERRVARIERQLQFANKELVGVVTSNVDPEGRNRVKVSCPDVYGATGESPWLLDQASIGGNGIGTVATPKIGASISFRLRDGNPDTGEYYGAPRDANSAIPEEFSDPNINGEKTESGIVIIKNDVDGSYSFETDGGMLRLHQDGTMDLYGIKCNIHMPTDLNSDGPQFGVVTSSPTFLCPLTGKPHAGSTSCKASD